jgi:hypothetical protein
MSSQLSRTAALPLVVLIGIAVACASGDAPAADSVKVCAFPEDSITSGAAAAYVKALEVKPYRFLVASRTDSALPEAAFGGLQTTGNVRYFPSNPAEQQAMRREYSASSNPTTTLLIAYHGSRKVAPNRTEADFSGTYIGGTMDGTQTPMKTILFNCDSVTWTPRDSTSGS